VPTPDQPPHVLSLGERLRLIRVEAFGEDGAVTLADQLGIPAQAWSQIEESGDRLPAELLLRFVELTKADPIWLIIGVGNKYRGGPDGKLDPEPLDGQGWA
jgi:hypothetical protein